MRGKSIVAVDWDSGAGPIKVRYRWSRCLVTSDSNCTVAGCRVRNTEKRVALFQPWEITLLPRTVEEIEAFLANER